MEEINKIELRSEEVQEILGHIPNKLIRYGIIVIFSVMLLLFIGSCFFKYPDIINANVTLLSENPPASIIAKTTGKIDYLLVEDGKEVEANQVLAVLETTANYKDVLYVENELLKLQTILSSEVSINKTIEVENYNKQYNLGESQTQFIEFLNNLKQYNFFIRNASYDKKIQALKLQIKGYERYLGYIHRQTSSLESSLTLSNRKYSRDSLLCSKKFTSQQDLEDSKKNVLSSEYSLNSALSSKAEIEVSVEQIHTQIEELTLQKNDEFNKLLLQLKASFDILSAQVQQWKKQYMIISPFSGKVTFNKYWAKNQIVKSGDIAFTVVPNKNEIITGKITVSSSGFGKIEKGQKVNLKFLNYPSNEFGMIRTTINEISLVPNESGEYTATVILKQPLITNYGKKLHFQQGMQGTAEIITKDLRFIERIINPIKMMVKEKM